MGSSAVSSDRTGRRLVPTITKVTTITKTRLVLFVIFVIFVAFVPSRQPVQASQAASEWPQFRGNPRLTGVAPSEVPATLSLKWTYQGGESFESSPAIADGVVYAGAGNGDLLAIDLASGKLRWKYATGNMIGESSPAVGGGFVYIGDLGGLVHAVNVRDGTRLWTFKTGSEI